MYLEKLDLVIFSNNPISSASVMTNFGGKSRHFIGTFYFV